MTGEMATFCLVNLGCPKNTVDSEGLMATMALAGFAWTPEPMEADVCLVNTCGFLEASRAPRDTYANPKDWDDKANDLASRFVKNFVKYESNAAGKALVKAGPKVK